MQKLRDHFLIYPASEQFLRDRGLTSHSLVAVMLPVPLIELSKQGVTGGTRFRKADKTHIGKNFSALRAITTESFRRKVALMQQRHGIGKPHN